jgi:ABC-type nickel/cobalt efflux system permease component RcnA
VAAVAGVGILHTVVPDHWLPIAVVAQRRKWSRAQTARAALGAGAGHVLSTLAIGLVVWFAGVTVAQHFGRLASEISSFALIAFGGWIAFESWRELRAGTHAHHDHPHDHDHDHDHERRQARAGSEGTALLFILGSSPMVEGIPVFFAAARYGPALLAVMAAVFALATIATYVVLCVYSSEALQRTRFGAFERYGEVASGLFIAAIGLVFVFVPL